MENILKIVVPGGVRRREQKCGTVPAIGLFSVSRLGCESRRRAWVQMEVHDMRAQRSSWQIWLPAYIYLGANILSWQTSVISLVWIFIGVLLLGHRPLRRFPGMGLGPEWMHGIRAHVLWFYHVAWWPWYVYARPRDKDAAQSPRATGEADVAPGQAKGAGESCAQGSSPDGKEK